MVAFGIGSRLNSSMRTLNCSGVVLLLFRFFSPSCGGIAGRDDERPLGALDEGCFSAELGTLANGILTLALLGARRRDDCCCFEAGDEVCC